MKTCAAPFSHTPAIRPAKKESGSKVRQVELRRLPQSSLEPYIYTTIPNHDSKIRVIELLGGDDADVRCKMHSLDLEGIHAFTIYGKRQTYETLSYTWHSQTLTHSLWCDGKNLGITQSLYDALKTLRRPSASRLLWIDQICINQSDLQERSNQVRLMRLIYNRANLVVAWLGKEDEYTATAFQLIDEIVTKHVSPEVSLKADPEAIWDKRAMDAMSLPHCPSFEWEALTKLFERTYSRRIWVVQEVVVASRVMVRCGSLTISWEYIEYIARSLLATGWIRVLKQLYGSNAVPNFVQTISNIKASFSELEGGRGIPLSLLLSASRSFESTDPRDKVIALVGLVDFHSLGSSSLAMLDYSKAVEDLYIEVTGHLIQREKSLNLLSSVEDISDRTFLTLPSWVPNYSVWQRHTILGSSILVAHLNFYAAGRTPVTVSWTEGSVVLVLDGLIHDAVESISENSLDRQTEDVDVVRQWLQLAEPLIRRGTLGIEAFWRTLIGDHGRHIFPAPEQYGTHFENYLFPAKTRRQGYLEMKALKLRNERDLAREPNALLYQAALGYVAPHRKFFTTKGGLIGLGPRSMQSGDSICILSGGRVPYVLRVEGNPY